MVVAMDNAAISYPDITIEEQSGPINFKWLK